MVLCRKCEESLSVSPQKTGIYLSDFSYLTSVVSPEGPVKSSPNYIIVRDWLLKP